MWCVRTVRKEVMVSMRARWVARRWEVVDGFGGGAAMAGKVVRVNTSMLDHDVSSLLHEYMEPRNQLLRYCRVSTPPR